MHTTDREKLANLLKHFSHAMLTTRRGEQLRSRPMAVMDAQPPGRLIFFTSVDSAKLEELSDEPNANVSMQDGQRFVSISGRMHVYRDARRTAQLWQESQRVWFPKGPEDPSLVLIEVEPRYVEYWDRSSPSALELIFNPSPKDLEALDDESARHGKADLGSRRQLQ
jgi:general stress protein 26